MDFIQIFKVPSKCYVCYVCHVSFFCTTPPKQQKAAHVLKTLTPKPLKGLRWNFKSMFLIWYLDVHFLLSICLTAPKWLHTLNSNLYYYSTIQQIELKFSECVTCYALFCTIYLVFAKLLLNSCINCTQIYYSYDTFTFQGITLSIYHM